MQLTLRPNIKAIKSWWNQFTLEEQLSILNREYKVIMREFDCNNIIYISHCYSILH